MKITITKHEPEGGNTCILCERDLGIKYMDVEILYMGIRVIKSICVDCNYELGRYYRGDMD